MHIVYCYIDLKDDLIKYVGLTSRQLAQRIKEHKENEAWVSSSSWKILYFTVNTKSESEAWESHLIALYKTYEYYNTAKKDWGLIDLFRNKIPQWKVYSIDDLVVDLDYTKYQIIVDTDDENLITEIDLELELDITKEDILCLIARRVIQPLARTENNTLVFWIDDLEKSRTFYKTTLKG
jgi:predicted GIY-YIG superfamily endonuclease